MRTMVFSIAIAFLFSGCATMKKVVDNKMYDNNKAPTVVVIGGMIGSDRALLEEFQKGIPNSFPILPNRVLPLSTAADEVLRQIREDEGITGRLILVAGSWAGLIARKIDAVNPGLVAAIVTVGTPTGGYPTWVNRFVFGVGDEESSTPLYVIASDGDWVVGLRSALDLGQRKVSGQKVFSGIGHFDLFRSSAVVQTVLSWVQKEKETARVETTRTLLVVKK